MLPPVDELRLCHYGCNARRGNRTRARARLPRPELAVELAPDREPRARDYAPARGRGQGFRSDLLPDQEPLFDLVDERDELVELAPLPAPPVFKAAPTDRKSVV